MEVVGDGAGGVSGGVGVMAAVVKAVVVHGGAAMVAAVLVIAMMVPGAGSRVPGGCILTATACTGRTQQSHEKTLTESNKYACFQRVHKAVQTC